MGDEYDIDTWGVWDPIGNAHAADCPCPYCDPSGERAKAEAAAAAEAEAERQRIDESRAISRMVLEHREKYDYIALAEERRMTGISYRLAYGLEVSPEDKRWHDEVLAKMRAKYERTNGES